MTAERTLQAIRYDRAARTLEILDQLLLPHETVYVPVRTVQDGHSVIVTMQVRGAPAIALVAMLALAADLHARVASASLTAAADAVQFARESLAYLQTSRPTAVNLFDAAGKMAQRLDGIASSAQSAAEVSDAVHECAAAMLDADVADNTAIGDNGARYIAEQVAQRFGLGAGQQVAVLTHCNTGSLATAGYGTALGIIRSLHKSGRLQHAFCTETRPYNQGSRLTAYELVYE
ncbi:nagb/rpia/CoA transferase-like protein, partial [Ramicandelaber brevisporus]